MDKFLAFGVTGLVLAAIYSVIASGLVVTYTTTGIFNFAHGAVGMISAFVSWQLRFDWGLPAPIALVLLLGLVAPVLGLAIEAIVRGLHDTSETIKLVVTIAMLSALIAARAGSGTRTKPGRSRDSSPTLCPSTSVRPT